jgi:hypothetical protein
MDALVSRIRESILPMAEMIRVEALNVFTADMKTDAEVAKGSGLVV